MKKTMKKIPPITQYYVILGFIVLAVFIMLRLPSAPQTPQREMNDLERRAAMSEAAYRSMLGDTTAERQSAASEVQSLRDGKRSVSTDTAAFYSVLRIALFITILVLTWYFIKLFIQRVKAVRASQA